jgi:hypothetical protein
MKHEAPPSSTGLHFICEQKTGLRQQAAGKRLHLQQQAFGSQKISSPRRRLVLPVCESLLPTANCRRPAADRVGRFGIVT